MSSLDFHPLFEQPVYIFRTFNFFPPKEKETSGGPFDREPVKPTELFSISLAVKRSSLLSQKAEANKTANISRFAFIYNEGVICRLVTEGPMG